jgi:hypothetical protein
MEPKWRFAEVIRGSQNMLGGGSQDRSLRPWDQAVNVGDGRGDLESDLLVDYWIAKWVNILKDIKATLWMEVPYGKLNHS